MYGRNQAEFRQINISHLQMNFEKSKEGSWVGGAEISILSKIVRE